MFTPNLRQSMAARCWHVNKMYVAGDVVRDKWNVRRIECIFNNTDAAKNAFSLPISLMYLKFSAASVYGSDSEQQAIENIRTLLFLRM